MPVVDFTQSLVYRYNAGGRLAPLLPVRLRLVGYEAEFLLLVDTGAERTLLEGVHVRAAGLDVFDGQPLAFQGFLGARTTAYLHKATLVIGDSEVETEIAFSTQPLARQVLGRDILSNFVLGLRERASEFYLAAETWTNSR